MRLSVSVYNFSWYNGDMYSSNSYKQIFEYVHNAHTHINHHHFTSTSKWRLMSKYFYLSPPSPPLPPLSSSIPSPPPPPLRGRGTTILRFVSGGDPSYTWYTSRLILLKLKGKSLIYMISSSSSFFSSASSFSSSSSKRTLSSSRTFSSTRRTSSSSSSLIFNFH